MTPDGHRKVTEALNELGIQHTLEPVPIEGQDVRLVTMFVYGVRPTEVLSIMRDLSLLPLNGDAHSDPDIPRFRYYGMVAPPGADKAKIDFVDLNVPK